MEAAAKRGTPLPDSVLNAPELLPGLDLYYEAFVQLTTCRTYDLDGKPYPIPWTAIQAYGERYRFKGKDFDQLVDMVRALDRATLENAYSGSKPIQQKNGSSGQSNP